MKISESDYVVCKDPQQPKKQPFLVNVTSVGEEHFKGILEHDRHLKQEHVKLPKFAVLANLGDDPTPGTYAGADARDIFKKTVQHGIWNDVHYLSKPNKAVRKALMHSLDVTGDKLDRMGFSHLFDSVCTEIRSGRGKYAGMYIHSGKEDKPHRLQLFLKDDHSTQMNYVLYHEAGHAIRYQYVKSPKIRSLWLKWFNLSVPVEPIEEKEFKKLLKRIEKEECESVGEFGSSLEEEDQRTLKTVLRFIKQIHHVGAKELNCLLAAQKYEQLSDLWPSRELDVSDLKPIVSEYATKNVEELFAESFAFYMTKKKLPKNIEKLLENTLSYAKDMAKKRSVLKESNEEGSE
jgi:hypothetical protein